MEINNDDREFDKAFKQAFIKHWLDGKRVYHNGVCYVFPHGKQHIVKIFKELHNG